MLNQAINSSIIIITTIPSARFSKRNWLELHLKHCYFLTNDKRGTILIGDSLVAGLSRYQNIWNRDFSFSTLNCGMGGDSVQNDLRQAYNLPAVKSVRNVVFLCRTNNLHGDAPEDVADGIMKIGSTFKRFCTDVNVFICGIFPCDCCWSINRVYIRCKQNFEIKVCPVFVQLYRSRHQLDSGQWFPNPELFYFDKIHLVEKSNSVI